MGLYTARESAKPRPALMFLHGGFAFGAGDLEACQAFMDAGYIVMCPMLRGENGNPGVFEMFLGEVEDAKAAAVWLAEQPGVDKSRIFAFGHSVGGGVSAMLSLRENVPVQHSGSSGGFGTASRVLVEWQTIARSTTLTRKNVKCEHSSATFSTCSFHTMPTSDHRTPSARKVELRMPNKRRPVAS